MINWRIIGHPANWLNLAAIAIFWVAVAYLAAKGLHQTSQTGTKTP